MGRPDCGASVLATRPACWESLLLGQYPADPISQAQVWVVHTFRQPKKKKTDRHLLFNLWDWRAGKKGIPSPWQRTMYHVPKRSRIPACLAAYYLLCAWRALLFVSSWTAAHQQLVCRRAHLVWVGGTNWRCRRRRFEGRLLAAATIPFLEGKYNDRTSWSIILLMWIRERKKKREKSLALMRATI
jgi:hypothetical protein